MWLKVDDSFIEHAKTIEAGARLEGGRGIGRVVAVWLEAALFCSRRLTDGFIPARVVARLLVDDAPLEVAEALVAVGLWTVEEGGYRFHDWLEYQPDAATVQARRARERARRKLAEVDTGDLLNRADTLPTRCTHVARTSADTLHARCDAPDPVPPRKKHKGSATILLHRPAAARMPACSIWEVRPHVLAAVHKTLELGPPYLDASGAPVLAELVAEVKRIASRDLGATWQGRELDAMITAALERRLAVHRADRAREAFRARETAWLRKLRTRGG